MLAQLFSPPVSMRARQVRGRKQQQQLLNVRRLTSLYFIMHCKQRSYSFCNPRIMNKHSSLLLSAGGSQILSVPSQFLNESTNLKTANNVENAPEPHPWDDWKFKE